MELRYQLLRTAVLNLVRLFLNLSSRSSFLEETAVDVPWMQVVFIKQHDGVLITYTIPIRSNMKCSVIVFFSLNDYTDY